MPGALAQVHDTFDDGDLLNGPTWTGTLSSWVVGDLDGQPALQSNGEARSDTIYVSTPSSVSSGTWAFTFAFRDVNLSNYNGARVYLTADAPDLSGAVHGYFVQFGTNNQDEVRLYRQDGDAASGRVELGRSARLAEEESGTLHVEVTRSEAAHWVVSVDGAEVLQAADSTYSRSEHMGFWVKHSGSAPRSYFFDDVHVSGVEGPADTEPPHVTSAGYELLDGQPAFFVQFSEPIALASARPTSFSVSGGTGSPTEVRPNVPGSTADALYLLYERVPPSGTYSLQITGIRDGAGNVMPDTTVAVTVHSDTAPPRLLDAVALGTDTLRVRFDEAVSGCAASHYEIEPAVSISDVIPACSESAFADTYDLLLGQPLSPAVVYTLAVRAVADAAGNVLEEAHATFSWSDAVSAVPTACDIVVNEIMYDPPPGVPEFIELFNRSDETFDLGALALSDATSTPNRISTAPRTMPPGTYAVLVEDGSAFSDHFPGVSYVEVATWSTLNNSGDAVVLTSGEIVIDSVAYRPSWGGVDASLERRDPGGPSNSPGNYGTSTHASGGTPGSRNSLFAPDVSAPEVRFAEVSVSDDRNVTLGLSEPPDPSTIIPSAFRLADGRMPARALVADGPATDAVDLYFDAPVSGRTITVASFGDLTGNRSAEATLNLAYPPAPQTLVINEIMFDPRADRMDGRPDQPEYFELFNTSTRTLSLRSLYWTDVPDENGSSDSLSLGDAFLSLPPGGFAVVFADTSRGAVASASKLARAFPRIDFKAPGITLARVPRQTLSLSDSGDLIALRRSDGLVLDSVFYDAGWHLPNLVDDEGVSLERVAPSARADVPDSWGSSVSEAGGTPGMPNSIFVEEAGAVPADDVWIEPSPFSPDGDGVADRAAIRYALRSTASLVRVRIFDSRGRLVRRLERAALAGPTGTLFWDGLDDAGRDLRMGIYVVLFEALDTDAGTSAAYKRPVVLARPMSD